MLSPTRTVISRALVIVGAIHSGPGGIIVTVMLALHCAVPPAPVKVPVYVFVAVGDTDVEPDGIATEPMPSSSEPLVTFCEVHERVALPPISIDEGETERVQDGADGKGGVCTMIVAEHTTSP